MRPASNGRARDARQDEGESGIRGLPHPTTEQQETEPGAQTMNRYQVSMPAPPMLDRRRRHDGADARPCPFLPATLESGGHEPRARRPRRAPSTPAADDGRRRRERRSSCTASATQDDRVPAGARQACRPRKQAELSARSFTVRSPAPPGGRSSVKGRAASVRPFALADSRAGCRRRLSRSARRGRCRAPGRSGRRSAIRPRARG